VVGFRQLRSFLAVVDAGGFHRAAEALHLSQPALSQQIAGLEDELGTALFIRHARGARPTPAGEALAHGARRALRELDRACADARLAGAGETGDLTLAFNELGGQHPLVGECLALYRAAFPGVNVRLLEMGMAAQHDALRAGTIDAGFHYRLPDADAPFPAIVLDTQPFALVLPERHPLAPRETLAMVDLAGQPLVLLSREANADTHDGIHASFAAAGVELVVGAQASSDSGLLTLVKAGFGLGLVMRGPRRMALAGLELRNVEGLSLAKDLVLAWNPRSYQPSLARFAEMLREER
jgi:Transcriptional regulator